MGKDKKASGSGSKGGKDAGKDAGGKDSGKAAKGAQSINVRHILVRFSFDLVPFDYKKRLLTV